MSPFLKKILHWAGTALAISGAVIVMFRLNEYSSELDFSRFDSLTWLIITIFVLIYGLANIILAQAWRNILEYFGAKVLRSWATKIYGLTQLAKYVPGNIMHLASRQAMGLAGGVGGWQLAKASIWEIGLISITGAFFLILVLPQVFSFVPLYKAIAGFIFALLLMGIMLMRFIGLTILRAFGYYVVFLSISGLVFTGLVFVIIGSKLFTPIIAVNLCSAFVVAWLAGLITPGSPAGIGVRELVLAMLLKGIIFEPDLFLAISLSRLVTVCGDVIFFLFASIFLRNYKKSRL